MCKVIAVAMQKGGCAKTSVSLNLGIGLARAGKKVLLIDNDPQGNLTASLGYEEPDDMSDTLASVMMKIINEEPIEPGYGILHHQEGIDLIPGNIELSGLEVLLANVMSRENILKEYIDQIKDQYGYIIIDCMPSLGMTTINALVAATSVLIPVPAAYLPVKGLCQLIKTISMVKKRLNKKLKMLNDLKNRGVKDVLFFCVDGLPGFKEAIQAVYPQAEIQRCVIHMLRNSFKYVNYNDLKKFSSDFKAVYNAPNETAALSELENIKEKWGKKYPYAISNWENNWEDVSSFFQFSNDIRRIMYTTNIIEGLNRQYRKVTKTKSVFPSDASLEKMLYLASENVVKKWTQRYRNWDQVLNQLIVLYGERLTNYL